MLPSCAVATTVTVVSPTVSGIAPEAAPEATVMPFTLMLAVLSVSVGVTVSDVTLLATEAV